MINTVNSIQKKEPFYEKKIKKKRDKVRLVQINRKSTRNPIQNMNALHDLGSN